MQTATLYHGSPKLFNKFDERTIQRGDFGYGFYLADTPDSAQKYSGKIGTKGFVYTVKCFLNQALSAEKLTLDSNVIQNIVRTIDKESGLLNDFDDVAYLGQKFVLNYATKLLASNNSDIDLFNELVTINGDAKSVTIAFLKHGYNYTEVKREFEHTFVFFDSKDINIINHIEIMN